MNLLKRKNNKSEDIQEPSDKVCLKTKDKAIVEFKFTAHQEFLEKDMIFFFREGTTRGVGKIV